MFISRLLRPRSSFFFLACVYAEGDVENACLSMQVSSAQINLRHNNRKTNLLKELFLSNVLYSSFKGFA